MDSSLEKTYTRSPDDSNRQVGTSNCKTYFLLLKSFVGTGILLLPYAFHQGGILFSIILIVLFGIYSFWCYFIIIKLKTKVGVNTFEEIGNKIIGKPMRYIILISLVTTQIGFASAYVIFIAENFKQLLYNLSNYDINIIFPIVFQMGFYILMSIIKKMKTMAIPALVANILILSGILLVTGYSLHHLFFTLNGQPAPGITITFNIKKWSLFIGTAIFAFEGVGLIIPIQSNMKNPNEFPKILVLVIITMIILFMLIAISGYLSYGELIKTIVLQNFEPGILVNIILSCFTVGILLSTPLQLFSLILLLENVFFPQKIENHDDIDDKTIQIKDELDPPSINQEEKPFLAKQFKWPKFALRVIVITIIIMLGFIASDKLNKLVAIVGSIACIPLVYIYPAILHLYSCTLPDLRSENKKVIPFAIDIFLIIMGLVGMIYTSYRSLVT